ncbi:MAG: hypothetical protein E7473_06695, partial [Ruminococcaceae bacterium]|nr:hypothetical protein [Oscillospiraceae bacterium]
KYKLTSATAFCQSSASSDIGVYILPMDLTVTTADSFNGKPLSEVFARGSSIYGNFTIDASTGYSVRNDAKKFTELGVSSENQAKYKVASLNVNSNVGSSAAVSAPAAVSGNSQEIELEGDTEYILLFCNTVGGKTINIESLTLKGTVEKKELTDVEVTFGEKNYVSETLIPKVKWFSDDEEIDGANGTVTVEIADGGNADGVLLEGTDGNIYAIAEGTATVKVTGTLDGVSASKEVTVDIINETRWAGANQSYMFSTKGHADMSGNQGITVEDTTSGRQITEEEFNTYAYRDYGEIRPWGMVSAHATYRGGKKYFTQYSTSMDFCGNNGDWIAFKVKVPAAGKYNIDVAGQAQTTAGLAAIYMLPYESTMTFSSVLSEINSYMTAENLVAEADFNSSTKEIVRLSGVGEFIADGALDYSKGYAEYLMIVKTCYSKKASGQYRVILQGIHLIGNPALSSAEVTFSEKSLGVGESTSVSSITGKDAAGAAADASKAYVHHVLSENDVEILSQSADGKTFTALKNGNATVKSYVILGGSVCTDENIITVDENATVTAAYIYANNPYEIGEDLSFDTRLEQKDRKVISGGTIESFEIVSNSSGAISLSEDAKTITAKAVGTAEVRAIINARGKSFESDIVKVTVVEPEISGNPVERAEIVVENTTVELGGTPLTALIKLFDADGTEIAYESDDIQKISWKSDNEAVATVSETGEIIGKSDGKAKITAVITYGGKTVSASAEVVVEDNSGVDLSFGVNVSAPESIYVYGSGELKLSVTMNSGNVITIPNEYITWNFSDESMSDVIEITDGCIYGKNLGKAVILATINPEYKNIGEIEVSPVEIDVIWDATINPQIYTMESRNNAKVNVTKYSWAKKLRDTAIAKADSYVENLDKIYNMAAPEGLPRFYYNGQRYDPHNNACRYCGEDLTLEYSKYGFKSNALAREWKVQCPECRRVFPSNKFDEFWKLGLTESKKLWSYEQALQKHHELFVCESVKAGNACTCIRPIDSAPEPGSAEWYANDPRNEEWYAFYGYGVPGGYLNNDLYKEIDEKLGVSGWAVDDGFGYRQPYVSKEMADEKGVPGYSSQYYNKNGYAWYRVGTREGPVVYTYAANFAYEGIWQAKGTNSAVMKSALKSLREAFLYTGDAKYGRAGVILLDKWADLYPYFDWGKWRSFRSDSYLGTTCDAVDSTYLAIELAESYDAFLPIYNDPYVVDYLSKSAPQYEMNDDGSWKRDKNGEFVPVNLKDSPGALRKNVEDNILLKIFEDARTGKVWGNFGLHQSSVVTAAIVLNREPQTGEMIDWTMRYGTGKGYNSVSVDKPMPEPIEGAYTLNHMISAVDRDGNGNENSTQYNKFWITYLLDVAEKLEKWTQNPENSEYKKYNLFDNPKFVKLFTAIPKLTLGGYYSPQMGDSDGTATATMNVVLDDCVTGFKYTGNHLLARVIYEQNNGVEGLHTSVYDAEPEKIQQDIQKIVDEEGSFSLESELLSGFGFAALRAGSMNESVNATTETNTQRDFALYFGMTNGHGHRDTMNLYMSAFGLNIAPDLGYPKATGTDPNRLQWVQTTISHNTVVVDEKEQPSVGFTGKAQHFDDAGRVKVMDVTSDIYSQCDEYRRSVVMVEVDDEISYGVDFFHIKGGNDHLYSFHSQSDEITAISGLSDLYEQPTYENELGELVGTYAGANVVYGSDPNHQSSYSYETKYPRGYTWLKNVRTYNSIENDFAVEYKVKDWNKVLPNKRDIRLRLTMVNDSPFSEVTFVTGEAPETGKNTNIGELEYLLVRNKGANLDTTFTTVYEPYIAGNKYIESIEKVSMVRKESQKPGVSDAYSAVRVTLKNGRIDYIIYSNNNKVDYVVDNKFNFRGFMGVVSLETVDEGEEIVYSYLNDGEVLCFVDDNEAEETTPAYTGTVKSFTEELSLENNIVYTPAVGETVDLDAIKGQYVYIENDGVQSGAYRIENASITSDGDVALDVGEVSVVRSYVDATDTTLGYVYNIKEGQSLRIPISNIYDASPKVEAVSDFSATAGSIITININAVSNIGKDITLIGTSAPRGMSIDQETKTITWKPTSSQIGENHIAITASDGVLETTIHFTVTVYGSTTSGSSGGGGVGTTTPTVPDTPAIPDVPDVSARFTDLGAHAWAADAINALADKGIIKGTSENTFSPAANITRADFAILLVRAFELSSDNTENFADVDASDYFAKELAIARNTGIVNGIGDNKYAPKNTISRQDMMVIVYRAMQKLGMELENGDVEYTDFSDVSDYAKEAVSALITAGLVNGKNGKIAPTDYTTRAEVAVLIKRIIDYTSKE